ncbi:trace amine-associated receptor 5, partial [Biomphalaria glabrata]
MNTSIHFQYSAELYTNTRSYINDKHLLVVVCICISLLTLFTILSNGVMMLAMVKTLIADFQRGLQTRPNNGKNSFITKLCMLSFAVCGAIYGLFEMPLSLLDLINSRYLKVNSLCAVYFYVDYCLTLVTNLHVTSLSVDMFLLVCKPLVYRSLSATTAYVTVAACWSLPVGIIVLWYFIQTKDLDECSDNIHNFNNFDVSALFTFLIGVMFLASLLLMWVMYFLVLCEILNLVNRSYKKKAHNSTLNHPATSTRNTSLNHPATSTRNTSLNHPATSTRNTSLNHPATLTRNTSLNHPATSTRNTSLNHPATLTRNTSLNHPATSTRNTSLNPPATSTRNTSLNPPATSTRNTSLNPPATSTRNTSLNHPATSTRNTSLNPPATSTRNTSLNPPATSTRNTSLNPPATSTRNTSLNHPATSTRNTSLESPCVPQSTSCKRDITIASSKYKSCVKSFRYVGLLLVIYTAGWLPGWVVYIMYATTGLDLPIWAYKILTWGMYCVYALNPVLYCLNKTIR